MGSSLDIKSLEKEIAGVRAGMNSPIYIYGTEMISSYYSRLHLKNKRVLSIAGSSDQLLNAYYFGAAEVVGFDINNLAKLFSDVKFTALKALPYASFLKFFGSNVHKGSFDHVMYLSFKQYLPSKTVEFFDKLYLYFGNDGIAMTDSVFFVKREYAKGILPQVNTYLKNNASYKKLQRIIHKKQLTFICADVASIAGNNKIHGKFDIINLSNVPNFVTSMYAKQNTNDPTIRLYDSILVPMRKLLKPKGKIIFYTYSPEIYPNPFAKVIPPITIPENLLKIKKREEFSYSEMSFPGLVMNFKGHKICFNKKSRIIDKLIMLESSRNS